MPLCSIIHSRPSANAEKILGAEWWPKGGALSIRFILASTCLIAAHLLGGLGLHSTHLLGSAWLGETPDPTHESS